MAAADFVFDAYAWRAAEAEALKRAGAAICDERPDEALKWQRRAERFRRNAYLVESMPEATR